MDCPRCGHPHDETARECVRCGVVFARAARPPRPRPATQAPVPAPASSGAGAARFVIAIVLVGVAMVGAVRWWRSAATGGPAVDARPARAATAAVVDTAPPEGLGEGFDVAPSVEAFDAAPVKSFDADSARDLAHVKALANRVPSDATPTWRSRSACSPASVRTCPGCSSTSRTCTCEPPARTTTPTARPGPRLGSSAPPR